ncbi:unnamed protein product [Caenorhabditis bovis]|uniref:Thioredoxin-like protein 1 n=1 Tax=Caenorhabditis bovis TaxID=2654633 RepID=A0A8S1FA04_9PELO|nr:unnamed protein product [Caenorhabditis bovis]
MPVIEVKDDNDYKFQFAKAIQGVLFVDFYADWCGPCKMMAPVFEELSNKFPNATFIKVNTNKCEETSASLGIASIPTFMAFMNGVRMDTIKGADAEALGDLVARYAEFKSTPSLVHGQSELNSAIDKHQIECLNGDDDTPIERFLDGNCNLKSDCDEQLIISIAFIQPVKVHSILIKGNGGRAPKKVKVFSNMPKTLDFDAAMALEPIQTLEYNETANQGDGQIMPLRFVKFQNVQNIQLFIENNQEGGEVTELVDLKFFGTPLGTLDVNKIKKGSGGAEKGGSLAKALGL